MRIADCIETLSEWTGRCASWLVVGLVLLTLYDVAMRYLFNSGSVALQELEWHLFALIILLGAGYTLKHDEHVRVDLFYSGDRLSDRQRAIVDLLGHLLLGLPFVALVVWASWPFAYDAFMRLETSPDPGGLPYRWLLKAAIPVGFTLLALQMIGAASRLLVKLSSDA